MAVAAGSLAAGLVAGTSPSAGAAGERLAVGPATARADLRSVAAAAVGADPAELREQSSAALPEGGTVTRFQQYVGDRPVEGGQVVVALDADERTQSTGGETAAALDDDRVTVSAVRASEVAVRAVADRLGVDRSALVAADGAGQVVLDPVIVGRGDGPSHVAWKVVVRPAGPDEARPPGGATVLVDARDGAVVSVDSHVRMLAQRAVCDGRNVRRPLVSVVCTVNDPHVRLEGAPALGVAQVDHAYDALGHVHEFFRDVVGVDIVTGAGFPGGVGAAVDAGDGPRLRGTARACFWLPSATPACPYPNASWYSEYSASPPHTFVGGSVLLGDGYERSLDVVGHEITHGVVAATAGLVYGDESGAIEESVADVFGELIEQLRSPDPRWVIGQDLPGLNGVRSMRDPQSFFCVEHGVADDCRQPDSMRSGLWRVTRGAPTPQNDYGGVHTNSGVGNKAAYLIAQGGRLGGQSVEPLGPTHAASVKKTARLYWRALNLLTPYADYADLAGALHQACRALVGTGAGAERFHAADCTRSVDRAVVATAMRSITTDTVVSPDRVRARDRFAVESFAETVQGVAVPGARVRLQRKVVGKRWKDLSTRWTDGSGRAAWNIRATRTARYRTVPVGVPPATYVQKRGDRVKVTAKITRKVKKRRILAGRPFVVTGKVRAKSPGKVLRLQTYVPRTGKWRNRDRVRIKKSSRFRIAHVPRSSADRRWRLVKPKEKTLRRGVSKPFRIKIRR